MSFAPRSRFRYQPIKQSNGGSVSTTTTSGRLIQNAAQKGAPEKAQVVDDAADERSLGKPRVPNPQNTNSAAEFDAVAPKCCAGRVVVRLSRDYSHVERRGEILAEFRQELTGRFRVWPVGSVDEQDPRPGRFVGELGAGRICFGVKHSGVEQAEKSPTDRVQISRPDFDSVVVIHPA